MTLPKPCPKPGLNGEPCGHDTRCYAPRETSPLRLPDVDAVARVIYESDGCPTSWATQLEGAKYEYRRNARDVLDLIAAHQPVWQRVEPGTLIKEGTRFRHEYENGDAYERIAAGNFRTGDGSISIDPRTIPEPEDPRVAVVLEFLDQTEPETHERDARELLARIDAARGDR